MTDTAMLTQLGAQVETPASPEKAVLEIVPFSRGDGPPAIVRFTCPEFTSLCPVTGQPDFGTLVIRYVPDRLCVELKSLKLYIWSFRDEGHYFEQVTNEILDDLVRAMKPRRLTVVGQFNVRGGITTRVVVRYEQPANRSRTKRRG